MSYEGRFWLFAADSGCGMCDRSSSILPPMGALPIHDMTFEEKLQAMEELWKSISSNEALVEIPEWHLDALRTTEANLQAGRDLSLDWESAKADLRKRAE